MLSLSMNALLVALATTMELVLLVLSMWMLTLGRKIDAILMVVLALLMIATATSAQARVDRARAMDECVLMAAGHDPG